MIIDTERYKTTSWKYYDQHTSGAVLAARIAVRNTCREAGAGADAVTWVASGGWATLVNKKLKKDADLYSDGYDEGFLDANFLAEEGITESYNSEQATDSYAVGYRDGFLDANEKREATATSRK